MRIIRTSLELPKYATLTHVLPSHIWRLQNVLSVFKIEDTPFSSFPRENDSSQGISLFAAEEGKTDSEDARGAIADFDINDSVNGESEKKLQLSIGAFNCVADHASAVLDRFNPVVLVVVVLLTYRGILKVAFRFSLPQYISSCNEQCNFGALESQLDENHSPEKGVPMNFKRSSLIGFALFEVLKKASRAVLAQLSRARLSVFRIPVFDHASRTTATMRLQRQDKENHVLKTRYGASDAGPVLILSTPIHHRMVIGTSSQLQKILSTPKF
ncbi:hypothetical protein V5O48_012675 [Marasmius crinis-equi]|uniref:Uncharacterized protein n=1 Tax=Marasmius crinis-equi TaxID=585013 RepID=A0ABR3F271_9AGAR